jgi:hypothetical protein
LDFFLIGVPSEFGDDVIKRLEVFFSFEDDFFFGVSESDDNLE